MRERKRGRGSLKDRNLTNHNRVQKLTNFTLLWDESTVRHMPQSRSVTHHMRGGGGPNRHWKQSVPKHFVPTSLHHDGSDGLTRRRLGKKLDTWWKGEQRVQKQKCLLLPFPVILVLFKIFCKHITTSWSQTHVSKFRCSCLVMIISKKKNKKKWETKTCVSITEKIRVWQNIEN